MSILEAKPSSNVSHLSPLPGIAEVYEAIRGEALDGSGDERRGHCLRPDHDDATPSCGYNVAKDTFNCLACEASGGVLDLIVAAGKAADRREAIAWARGQQLVADTNWGSAIRYDYTDENGALLYQVGRWNLPGGKKMFKQRVPDINGGWKKGPQPLKGVERVPYRLADLRQHAASADPAPLFVVEGEKDAENVVALGASATTSAQGASLGKNGAWPVKWAEHFRGLSTVYVLADNDDAGEAAARQRAAIIAMAVPRVLVLCQLPGVAEKGDVSDWILRDPESNTLAALVELCERDGEVAEPYQPPYHADIVPAIVASQDDIGAALFFNRHYSGVARYISEEKGWRIYRDGVWTINRPVIEELSTDSADKLRLAARDLDDEAFQGFADSQRFARASHAMLEKAMAKNHARIDIFDKHPIWLNLANGTLDLATMAFWDHRSEDYFTLRTDIAYDPAAKCPRFEQWLRGCCTSKGDDGARHFDEALYVYVLQVMGTCLEARAGLRMFFFLFGPKGTGKSTFVKILGMLLGPYAGSIDFKALCESRFSGDGSGPTPQLAALRGLRMVSAAEASANLRLDASRIKQLVGDDPISGRKPFQDLISFPCEATMIMTGNEMPRIIGDDSIWSKLMPVPFLNEIETEDPEFVRRDLVPELPGILNLALEGYAAFCAAGCRLVEPPCVTEARRAAFDEQDAFRDFVQECLEITNVSVTTKNSDVRHAYAAWAKMRSQYAVNERDFYAAMKRHGALDGKSKGVRTWKNIRIKDYALNGYGIYGGSEF